MNQGLYPTTQLQYMLICVDGPFTETFFVTILGVWFFSGFHVQYRGSVLDLCRFLRSIKKVE
jgi:hypothetical protein